MQYLFIFNSLVESLLRMSAVEVASAISKGKRLKRKLSLFLKAVPIFLLNDFLCLLKIPL